MRKSTKQVKVLLMQDVSGLGTSGELVSVAPGHARNHLLPLGKAAVPTAENLRTLEARKAKYDAEIAAKRSSLDELAAKIPETNVNIEMKVNEEGHLYGAVTAQMIAEAMNKAGLDITAQNVRLEEPIKERGQYDVPIHVYDEVVVEARVWVVNAAD